MGEHIHHILYFQWYVSRALKIRSWWNKAKIKNDFWLVQLAKMAT